jgi:hypothetical protein
MTNRDRPWPPLIVAEHTPRLIRWRDFLLTLMMWLLFAGMLETEFEMFFGHYLERWGLGDFDTEGNWPIFFDRLMPFFETTLVLVWFLILASVLTLRRRRRSLLLPEPAPLGLAEESRRSGMTEAELTSARALRIAVVHLDAEQKIRVTTE